MARQSSTSSESSPRPSGLSPPRDVDPSAGTSPYHPLPTPYHAPTTPHATWPTSSRPEANSPAGYSSSNVRPSPRVSQAREDPPASSSAETRQKGKDADEDAFVRSFVRLQRPDEVQVKSFMGKVRDRCSFLLSSIDQLLTRPSRVCVNSLPVFPFYGVRWASNTARTLRDVSDSHAFLSHGYDPDSSTLSTSPTVWEEMALHPASTAMVVFATPT